MPKKQTTTGLAGKLGDKGRKAVKSHAKDEVKLSAGGDLPGGIEGGIAQIVECKFDVFKKGDNVGEYFFLAAGTVVEPASHNGIPLVGLRTQIGPEPVCDTPQSKGKKQTLEDHIEWILNELRKLGVDTNGVGIESLEDVVAVVKEEAPFFRFRTWQGEATKEYPNPRVNHDWRGAIPDYEGADVEDVVDDNSAAEEEEEVEEEADEVEVEEVEAEEVEESVALDELGELADADDEEAQEQLTTLAEEAGVDPSKVDTWGEVAAMLSEGGVAAAEATAETAEMAPPVAGEVFFYKPPRKKVRAECEVTAVFKSKEVCNLKNLDDNTVYKGVSWSDMHDTAK